MKNEYDLEPIILQNSNSIKSQTLNLNSQSLTIKHNCIDEINCTFTKHSPKKDCNGTYIIQHNHKDYGKVDLAHLNNYPKLLSLSHYDCNDNSQKSNITKEVKKISNSKNNDRYFTNYGEIETQKEQEKCNLIQQQSVELNELTQPKIRNDKPNNNTLLTKSNNEYVKFKAYKKPKIENDETNKVDDYNKAKLLESKSDNGLLLNFGLNPKKDKPITIKECIETSSSSKFQQMLSKYKMTIKKDIDNPKSSNTHRNQMMKMFNKNSNKHLVQWDELKGILNDSLNNKYNRKSRNDYRNHNICNELYKDDNIYSFNKLFTHQTQASSKLKSNRFNWWLYYNSIIYPSNSIEESIVKIDQYTSFK